MAKVEITVNGRPYNVGCEDGHEDRLMRLARRFDSEVSKLSERVGQIGDLRLFLMAGLVMCDELEEAERKAETATAARAQVQSRAAALLARAAERVEAMAAEGSGGAETQTDQAS